MVVISNLCGYVGYRPVAMFSQALEELFVEALQLRHGVPSHVTFREVLQRTDHRQLIDCFNKWAGTYAPVEAGNWLSGDGKALGSTLENMHNSKQDFQVVVSFFSQQSGLVHLIDQFRNAEKSEIEVVRNLLEHLQGAGALIRLDALHTKKND